MWFAFGAGELLGIDQEQLPQDKVMCVREGGMLEAAKSQVIKAK